MEMRNFKSFPIEWVFVFLFAYISWVPFYYFQPLSLSTPLPFEAPLFLVLKFLPFLISLLLMVLGVFSGRKFHLSPIDWCLFFYLFFSFLSLVKAENGILGAGKIIYFSITGLSFFFLMRNIDFGHIYRIVRWIAFICGPVAVYGWLVFLLNKDFIWGFIYDSTHYYNGTTRISSTLGNPLIFGGYLTLSIPLFIYFSFCAKNRTQQVVFLFFLFSAFASLFLTFSRSAWISVGVVAGIWLISFRHIWFFCLRKCWNLFFLIAILLALPAGIMFLGDSISRAAGVFSSRTESSLNTGQNIQFRIAQFSTTSKIIRDHPLLGIGFGNFTRFFEVHKDKSVEVFQKPDAAHTTDNMYLMVIAETGILGSVSLFSFLFYQMYSLFCLYRTMQNPQTKNFLLCILSGISGFLVNVFFWDGLNQPTMRIFFWCLLGMSSHFLFIQGDRKKWDQLEWGSESRLPS
jgi:putative inorganic carbon (hco3(-)) transporter